MSRALFMLQRNITTCGGRLHGRREVFDKQRQESRMQEPLADGGLIRKLWIGEAARYRDHLLRLDPMSRNSRFGGGVADEFIENYADSTFGLSATVHGYFADGVLRGAAELRPLGPGFSHEAEAAMSIEAPWQSHGIGSALLKRTLLAARNRGIRTLHMACLANNRRMQELARKFSAELSFDFGSVVGEVAAARPTPLSVLRELVADHQGFATAVMDVQSRLWKPKYPAENAR
jgi:GNAT superfamily N-acetyltransferase